MVYLSLATYRIDALVIGCHVLTEDIVFLYNFIET